MSKLKRKEYESLLEPMQEELVRMARWVAVTGQRVVVLFEGRDTAGKGGAIQAIASRLNPRQCRTVALPKPTEAEAGQWYFQRYAAHLPTTGQIVHLPRILSQIVELPLVVPGAPIRDRHFPRFLQPQCCNRPAIRPQSLASPHLAILRLLAGRRLRV